MTKAPTFRMSANTRFLVQELEKLKEGDRISYADLCSIAGLSLSNLRSPLDTARTILMRDQGIVFGVERGIGLIRLNESEILASTSQEIKGIRQKARKGIKKLAATDYNKMTPQEQLQYTIKGAVFAMSNEAASSRGQKKIAAVAEATKAKELPISQVAEGFIASLRASSKSAPPATT